MKPSAGCSRVKFRLGLFDHPYTKEIKPEKRFLMPQNLRLVEQLAEETMVLLKNSDNLLPLSDVKTIALVGPLAKEQADLLGSWSGHGRAGDVCSIFDAVTREFSGKADILYAQGCGFEGTDRVVLPKRWLWRRRREPWCCVWEKNAVGAVRSLPFHHCFAHDTGRTSGSLEKRG